MNMVICAKKTKRQVIMVRWERFLNASRDSCGQQLSGIKFVTGNIGSPLDCRRFHPFVPSKRVFEIHASTESNSHEDVIEWIAAIKSFFQSTVAINIFFRFLLSFTMVSGGLLTHSPTSRFSGVRHTCVIFVNASCQLLRGYCWHSTCQETTENSYCAQWTMIAKSCNMNIVSVDSY